MVLRLRDVLLRLAFAIGGILMALVVMEVVLSQPGQHALAREMEPDPTIGARHVPGGQFDYKTSDFSVHHSFNSLGFRDREHAVAKVPGTFRIIVLGDSFMDGLQVADEETFARRLESRLQGRGIPAEVVNLGMQGFGTRHELFALESYGLKFQPDLAVLSFFMNDLPDNVVDPNATNSRFTSYFVRTPSGELKRVEHAPLPQQNPLVGAFRKMFPSVYSWMAALFRSGGDSGGASPYPSPYDNFRVDLPVKAAEAWNLTLDILRLVRDRAAESGAKMLVFRVPDREELYPEIWQKTQERYPALKNLSLDFGVSNRTLQNFSRANGIPYLDLEPGLRDVTNRTGRALYFTSPNEGHWNSLGHDAAAALVADRLVEEGLVPAGKPLKSPTGG